MQSLSPEIVYLGSSKRDLSATKRSFVDKKSKSDSGNNKKKRDLSAFVQSDLQDFKRQRQVREHSLTSPVTFVKEESLPMVDVQQDSTLAFDGTQDQGPTTLGSPIQPLPMPPTPAFVRKPPEKISSSFTASPPHSGQVIAPQIVPSLDQISTKNIDVVPRLVRSMTFRGPTHNSSPSLMLVDSSDMPPALQTTHQTPNESSSSSRCEQVRFLDLCFY